MLRARISPSYTITDTGLQLQRLELPVSLNCMAVLYEAWAVTTRTLNPLNISCIGWNHYYVQGGHCSERFCSWTTTTYRWSLQRKGLQLQTAACLSKRFPLMLRTTTDLFEPARCSPNTGLFSEQLRSSDTTAHLSLQCQFLKTVQICHMSRSP